MATLKYKAVLFLAFVVVYLAFYVYPNYFPLEVPSYLPMFSIDRNTPFLPWTILVYISDYPLCLAAILMIHDLEQFKSFARMMFLTIIICGTFFLFFPTIYPRPEFIPNADPITNYFMQLVHSADKPTNCFPSAHVALTGSVTWALRSRPTHFVVFLFWSFAIFVSTLTTKQHYFVDIIGGMSVVAAVAFIDWAFTSREVIRERIYRTFQVQKS